jgi:5'-nucleotidase
MDRREPFHILLTNDDGHAAPGIRAMQSVLLSEGYRVSLVAPSQEQSATSMSTTTRRNMPLEPIAEGGWHLDAQPADTVLVALRHLLHDDPPDLVVSGINFGPNLGIGLHASGTIGAAVIAALNGYPAIAVSAGMLFEEALQTPPQFPSTHRVLDPAARFTCRVIESLRSGTGADGGLLPSGVLLNINYPPLPVDAIKGVRFPEVSAGHLIELGYRRCEQTGHVMPHYHRNVDPDRPELEAGDVRAHLEGYITVSPVKPSWNPPDEESRLVQQRLNGLFDKGIWRG